MTSSKETGGAANPTQLSDGNPSGTVLGNGPNDLIGFYGVTPPVARQDNSVDLVTQMVTLGLVPIGTTVSGGGGGGGGRTVVTASDTIGVTDYVIGVNVAGAVALSVNPASLTRYTPYIIKDISFNASLFPITITAASGKIDNLTSPLVMNNNGQSMTYFTDGTNLYITG